MSSASLSLSLSFVFSLNPSVESIKLM
jgi:hypothetical protein